MFADLFSLRFERGVWDNDHDRWFVYDRQLDGE
jgi:hypothetical protein